jgi:hypothetical protein
VSSSSGHPPRKSLSRLCSPPKGALGLIAALSLMPVLAPTGASASGARTADAPSAPCVLWGAAHSCESSNPKVTLEVINERETSLCTFHESWTWGDGSASEEATLRGSVEGSTQLLGSHTYGQPGTYTITVGGYVAAEEPGLEYTCEAPPVEYEFTLLPGGGVLGSEETKAAAAPALTNVRQSHRVWREGSKLARVSQARKPPIGTAFSLTLDQQATVHLSFTRPGTKAKGTCKTKNPGHKASCRRSEQVGSFSFTGHAGVSKVSFQGRISATKKLLPGKYTLTIVATNAAGKQSATRSLSFTIVK